MNQLVYYLIITPPLLFAFTFHEFSHALVALRKGDPTAKYAGRLTLNPLPHIDLIGLALLYLYGFGWAKPVPVNPGNFRNPRKDELWVSLAGPASNMVLALVFGILFRVLFGSYVPSAEGSAHQLFLMMVIKGVELNLVLAIFNILPIKPLDGSHILLGILPPWYEPQLIQVQKVAPFVLLGVIALDYFLHIGILWSIFKPFIFFFGNLFAGPDFIRLINV